MDSEPQSAKQKLIQHKIIAEIADNFLRIQLDILKDNKPIKRFMTALDDASLPQDVKNNFSTIVNVKSILENPKDYVIDPVQGKITLLFNVTFPNGFTSTLTGVLQLVEQQITEIQILPDTQLKGEVDALKDQLKRLQEHLTLRQSESEKEVVLLKEKIEKGMKQQQNNLMENRSKTMIMFQQKIEDLHNKMQQQKSYFLDIVDELKESNKELRQELKASKQQIKSLIQDKNTLKQVVQVLISDKEVNRIKFQQIDEKFSKNNDEFIGIKNQIFALDKKSGESQLSFNMEDSQEFSPTRPKSKKIPMEINMHSPYLKHFLNNGKYLVYNGNEESTQILGKITIRQNPISCLTVAKTKMNQIGFGVMDAKYIQERNSHKKPYYIMYYGWNGGVYESGKCIMTQGTGFKSNQTVKMVVKPNLGVIRWEVGGIVEAEHASDQLKDQSIVWVPFVRMCNPGDSVKWYYEE